MCYFQLSSFLCKHVNLQVVNMVVSIVCINESDNYKVFLKKVMDISRFSFMNLKKLFLGYLSPIIMIIEFSDTLPCLTCELQSDKHVK